MLVGLGAVNRVSACAVLAAVILAPARSAAACECVLVEQAEAFAHSDAVFEGRVLAIEEAQPEQPTQSGAAQRHVRMMVVRTWRGADAEEVVVTTASAEAACGYPFEVARSYLVYARTDDSQGLLSAGLCSRTRPADDASGDLDALGVGVTPVSPHDPEEPVPALTQRAPAGHVGCASCAAARGDGPTPWSTAAACAGAVLLTARRRRRAS